MICLLFTRAILYLGSIVTMLAHRNNTARVDMSIHWTHYHDSEPTRLVFALQDSLVLRA